MSDTTIVVHTPAELRYRYLVLRLCGIACGMTGSDRGERTLAQSLEDSFVASVVSALSEIFNNIVIHSQTDTLTVRFEVRGEQVVLTTSDRGEPLAPNSLRDPWLVEAVPESGMGVFIARQSLDDLEYHPGPPNRWVLKKRRRERAGATRQ